jgi:hypothetical protein
MARRQRHANDQAEQAVSDPVDKPAHYNNHPSGVECIEITKHFNFALGNVIKYVWRADAKGNALEDLRKAQRYLAVEIARREVEQRQSITREDVERATCAEHNR